MLRFHIWIASLRIVRPDPRMLEKEKNCVLMSWMFICSARGLKTEFESPSRRSKNIYQDLKKKEIVAGEKPANTIDENPPARAWKKSGSHFIVMVSLFPTVLVCGSNIYTHFHIL